jgi:hypothetical protein
MYRADLFDESMKHFCRLFASRSPTAHYFAYRLDVPTLTVALFIIVWIEIYERFKAFAMTIPSLLLLVLAFAVCGEKRMKKAA